MPNITNHLYRLWCKKCEDFTIHERVFKDELEHPSYSLMVFEGDKTFGHICQCKTQYTEIKISKVDKDKLEIQRKRFKQQRKENVWKAYSVLASAASSSIFSSDFGHKTVVIESDAGLEQEEKLIREEELRIKELQKEELIKFKNVSRNDTCLCGSNHKYKKCCLPKHNTYNVSIN